MDSIKSRKDCENGQKLSFGDNFCDFMDYRNKYWAILTDGPIYNKKVI